MPPLTSCLNTRTDAEYKSTAQAEHLGYSLEKIRTHTCSWQMPAMVPSSRIRNTPAATAAPASPAASPAFARCAATSDEEQAVWVARQGPEGKYIQVESSNE